MKKWFVIVLILVLLGTALVLCGMYGSDLFKQTAENRTQFTARVLALGEDWVLVEPLEGEAERNSCDQITFSTQNLEQIDAQVGLEVVITYNGEMMESYPAQIIPQSWKLKS